MIDESAKYIYDLIHGNEKEWSRRYYGWDKLNDEVKALRQALGFAASVIKSGEPWTDTCEKEIGSLLKQ